MGKLVKKIAFQLHLWLGAISGIVVFIVCATGAIWAVGLHNWLGTSEAPIRIESHGDKLLPPSVLMSEITSNLKGLTPNSITYTKQGPTEFRVYNDSTSLVVAVNPYTAKVVQERDNRSNGEYKMSFWDYMRWGHRALWLPWWDAGRLIVNYATLLFFITIISGLIIWMPKSWKGIKNRLWFNWRKGTKQKRKFYDLHLVLGFYAALFLLIICSTGMVWGIQWWSKSTYFATTGKALPSWQVAQSDTTLVGSLTNHWTLDQKLDYLFRQAAADSPDAAEITINPPLNKESAITINISHDKSVRYDYDGLAYDQYSLQPIEIDAYYTGRYEDKSWGEKLRRQNYDLHIGRIWGPVGEVLIFFAAVFGASLPLTGYYILFVIKRRGRRKLKSKN